MIDVIQFPRGYWHQSDLDSTPVAVLASGEMRIVWMALRGGAAARTLILRSIADVDRCRIDLGISTNIVIPGLYIPDGGLEVLTDSATGDVGITIAYQTTIFAADVAN